VTEPAPVVPTAPVASKVKTASVGAALPVILYGLYTNTDIQHALITTGIALLSAVTAFATGWLTKHTPR
jgi:hypothetical protein